MSLKTRLAHTVHSVIASRGEHDTHPKADLTVATYMALARTASADASAAWWLAHDSVALLEAAREVQQELAAAAKAHSRALRRGDAGALLTARNRIESLAERARRLRFTAETVAERYAAQRA